VFEPSVLVVDDEPVIREYFAHAFPWEQTGLRWVGDAADGEAALAECRRLRPDLVLADITMPGMNGLDLLGELRATLPDTQVVILTCHRDFDYVRTAMRLGALDYMVKATTSTVEMVVELNRIRAQVEKRRSPTERWKRQAQPLAKLLARGGSADLRLREGHVRLVLLLWEDAMPDDPELVGDEEAVTSQDVEALLDRVAAELGEALWAALKPGLWALAVSFEPGCTPQHSAQEMARAFLELKLSAGRRAILTAGLGEARTTLAELPSARTEAERALATRFYLGTGSWLAHPAPWRPEPPDLKARLAGIAGLPADPDAPYAQHAASVIGQTLALCEQHWIDPQRVKVLVASTLHQLASGPPIHLPENEVAMWPIQAAQAATARDLRHWAVQAVTALVISSGYGRVRPEISRVIAEVRADCSRSRYDLPWAASLAGLHPNYFSLVFREETGQTFTDFLARVRMEKAVVYLREGIWKTNQVARMVGVPNYTTFFQMFRRVMGVSPTEYKRSAELG